MSRSLLASVVSAAALVSATFLVNPTQADVPQPEKKLTWAIVIHGGAGGGVPKAGAAKAPTGKMSAREELMMSYLTTGREMLAKGATAMDTCEKIVRAMEDSGKFNCGKGATSTGEGKHSLDAAIMDGSNLKFGSIAGVKTIKNPISTARAVMDKTKHVMIIGPGAEEFAAKSGQEIVPLSYFNANKKAKTEEDDYQPVEGGGTVGCVCLDQKGNLCAATSTGGIGVVMPGRVGDAPICGAGTYANNKTCAVSGTGTGEYFIRHNVAHTISALMEYKGLSAQKAADEVVMKTLSPGIGGVIVVSHTGEIAMPFNTASMARAAADSSGRIEVGTGAGIRSEKVK
ncbi:MAG TPA: isoaspartyl peptidase/L-asparaginase [Gemmataceae bacterium]|nr:isoaspartyl peptidase/L-asparaginase [Gemmataceae bacterium]